MSEVFSEHLGYFALRRRLEYYSRSLSSVLQPGDTVADLGCGFGVLGLLALKEGARHVWGIDSSDAIEVARESMRRAGFSKQYTCTRASTFDVNLPEKVDLLICDHVGFFGLDYGILSMLADARDRLLKPGGHIMPRRIRLIAAGVASPSCREKADSWAGEEIPDEFRWLHDVGVNTRYAVDLNKEDLCTQQVVLGEVDFTKDYPDNLSFGSSLEVLRNDRIDGIAGWFECELADNVWMTNSPLSPESIGRCQAFFPARKSFAVEAGNSVDIEFRFRFEPQVITWSIQPPGGSPRQRLSTWASTILTEQDLDFPSNEAVSLNAKGQAHLALLELVDGKRSVKEIEDIFVKAHPSFLPTESRIRSFVSGQLPKLTKDR